MPFGLFAGIASILLGGDWKNGCSWSGFASHSVVLVGGASSSSVASGVAVFSCIFWFWCLYGEPSCCDRAVFGRNFWLSLLLSGVGGFFGELGRVRLIILY